MSDSRRKLILGFAVLIGVAPSCFVLLILVTHYVLTFGSPAEYPMLACYGFPSSIRNYIIFRLLVRFNCLDKNHDTVWLALYFTFVPSLLSFSAPLCLVASAKLGIR